MVFCNMELNVVVITSTSHNPYFNRWFSAILLGLLIVYCLIGHNPYFNRWFSAMNTPMMNQMIVM